MASYPCTDDPNEVVEKIVSAEADADKFSLFVNGSDTQTVPLSGGAPTPSIRNVVRQMFSAAAELPNADVSGKGAVANGGETMRTLAERFADRINVKDFGAKGDGIADDAPAIKAAVAAMKAVQVEVDSSSHATKGCPALFFPYGVYLVSEEIEVSGDMQLSVISDGATIKATETMDSVLKLDGCRMWGGFVFGLVVDMNHVAKIGMYITTDCRKVSLDRVTVKNPGKIVGANEDVPIGLYLEGGNGDGFGHRIKDISIIEESSSLLVAENFNCIGIKIDTPDIVFGSASANNMITGIEINAGNVTFDQCDVGFYAAPEEANWERVVNIKDNAGDTFFSLLGLHNGKLGYWIRDQRDVTIGQLFYIKAQSASGSPSPTSDALTPVTPIVFSVGKNSHVSVGYMNPYYNYISKDKVIITYNRDCAEAYQGGGSPEIESRPRSGLVKIKHSINATKFFKLVDDAFNAETNFKETNLASNYAETLSDGYYFLGYLRIYGSEACRFNIATSYISADLDVVKLGSVITVTPTVVFGSSGSSHEFCLGNAIQDSVYGFSVYPVYFRKNYGENYYSNISIHFESKSPYITFYRAYSSGCATFLVSSPSLLVSQAFA